MSKLRSLAPEVQIRYSLYTQRRSTLPLLYVHTVVGLLPSHRYRNYVQSQSMLKFPLKKSKQYNVQGAC